MRENKLGGKIKKTNRRKKKEEKKLHKMRKEVLKATKLIYIEPLTSRSPLAFQESNKSSKEEKNVEREIFEALQHVAIVGEGFEETLRGL